ncbi:MAG: hypothetical protein OXI63_11610 [Candidatus Poribacteria bacterium]|nr:hypothetical protein [Candidatus Poribacteria bacterium]
MRRTDQLDNHPSRQEDADQPRQCHHLHTGRQGGLRLHSALGHLPPRRRLPRAGQPQSTFPSDQPIASEDMRRTFVVHYTNGSTRTGTIYVQGNIMMDDGELYANLNHLITDSVSFIQLT